MGVLGHVADYDEARSIVATVMGATLSGSHLTLWDGTDTRGLIALVALVVAVLALLNDRVSAEEPDPPPSATVQVQVQSPDRAEVERIVEEHLPEQEPPLVGPFRRGRNNRPRGD